MIMKMQKLYNEEAYELDNQSKEEEQKEEQNTPSIWYN